MGQTSFIQFLGQTEFTSHNNEVLVHVLRKFPSLLVKEKKLIIIMYSKPPALHLCVYLHGCKCKGGKLSTINVVQVLVTFTSTADYIPCKEYKSPLIIVTILLLFMS